MNRSLVRVLSLASALAAGASPALAVDAPDTVEAAAPMALSGPQVGAPAPDFALTTIAGKRISLASFHGKTLVVNVWATWCPPCRQEMPELISTATRLQKSGVAVLGIDTTEEAPIVRAYVAAKSVSYPQAIDETKSFSTAYDVQYFPTTYVIDPAGVLRARYIDVIAPPQLDALVAAANAGRNGTIASPLQSKIDATLGSANFSFDGDGAAIEKNAHAVATAIKSAEQLLEQSDAASGNATDLLRTRAEEATIRDRAIAALGTSGVPLANASALPMLEGDAASDREQWQSAIDAYLVVLASDPKNEDALGGVALAAARLKTYAAVVDADSKLAALEPGDSNALVDLARAQANAGTPTDAYATFDKALALAQANVAAHAAEPKYVRALAYAHLYYGRVYAKAGDATNARVQFDRALSLASSLPSKDPRRDMYVEESQEGLVSLRLGTTGGGSTLSIAPWTGAPLRGSIPNTLKYRIVVAGDPGKNVTLLASEVPKGWVASFCSDRVCAPRKVAIAIPSDGVKIVEFQLVPPGPRSFAPRVRVTSTGDGPSSSATT